MSRRRLTPLTFLLLLLSAMGSFAETDLTAVRAYREANGARILKDFARFLSIPNVARDTENIRRNAEHLRAE